VESARPAGPGDHDAVVALARAAIEELRDNRGGAVWSRREAHAEPVEEAFTEAVAGAASPVCVVGLVDDVIVGYGLMRSETLHDGSTLATISDLYVHPQARGIGIGEAMMAELETTARSWGAIGLDGIVLPGDRASKNFFETFGLTARAILVHRSLEDGAG
jgi:GNAT superfamily N-acetyltransferase